MGELAQDYEIRLHYPDGRLSVVMVASATSDSDATAKARLMLKNGLANGDIWRDGEFVGSVYALYRA